jgi:NAD(P)-dependent dehydrogenase (short-subunit alcohol dehydrogenase family)
MFVLLMLGCWFIRIGLWRCEFYGGFRWVVLGCFPISLGLRYSSLSPPIFLRDPFSLSLCTGTKMSMAYFFLCIIWVLGASSTERRRVRRLTLSRTYKEFLHHLTTNTIGPLLTAQALLKLSPAIPIHTLVFMSSDSGSAARFRAFEDGFAAYAASKAALNQGLRVSTFSYPHCPSFPLINTNSPSSSQHLAAELPRHSPPLSTVILALHPGEVATDMANVNLAWEVEGIITPEESVEGMLKVIDEKGMGGVDERGGEKLGVATFWTWEGNIYPW